MQFLQNASAGTVYGQLDLASMMWTGSTYQNAGPKPSCYGGFRTTLIMFNYKNYTDERKH